MATDINWPADLPQSFLAGSLTKGSGISVKRQKMTMGSKGRFNGFNNKSITGQIEVSSEELETFESFVEEDVRGSARRFNFPNPFGAGFLEVSFLDRGEELFYEISDSESFGFWLVSFSLQEWR